MALKNISTEKQAERLRFDTIAPGRDFHAALAQDFPRRADCLLHTHDFTEALYVLDGPGTHLFNGTERLLSAGDLVWIRPQDKHGFCLRPSQKLHFINIAFRQSVWDGFRRLALEAPIADWEASAEPLAVPVPPARRGDCALLFQEMLRRFHAVPTRLALCRFWAETLPLLLPEAAGEGQALPPEAGPPWLVHACLALRSPEALQAGVPRLVALAGVSPTHLARTLKACRGQTPTEFVNTLRLEQAAVLLATTTDEIGEVADTCGFENLSYFYRLFHRRYGLSPRRYRLAPPRAVLR